MPISLTHRGICCAICAIEPKGNWTQFEKFSYNVFIMENSCYLIGLRNWYHTAVQETTKTSSGINGHMRRRAPSPPHALPPPYAQENKQTKSVIFGKFLPPQKRILHLQYPLPPPPPKKKMVQSLTRTSYLEIVPC